ncbi:MULTISPECIES: 3'-5' exonuclease [unclassified Schaalia]|uniref:3'-5' exonuclease n=1 Tax=unclassified Schaalia TaxID=2691889 RepID=UPI001E3D973B|nr:MULTISPECIES: 3'-5' exonuclease [unclassified Schaalia]MCD4548853.1 3'-5' exonuclease [Schaalia sp. lx-260]MCD4557469.1 3'-5' exonuclease [Schaalia sp. lx-100]
MRSNPFHFEGAYQRSLGRASSRWVPSVEVLLASSFVAVDFETANSRSGASACQIALVKVVDGQIIDTFSTLLKPPRELNYFVFSDIHGITGHHVRHAPSWEQIAQEVSVFVAGLPAYAHNATFDSKVWRELDEYFGVRTYPADFYCTYRTARKMVSGLQNYKLPTVTKALAPAFRLKHHDATSDAQACAMIVLALQNRIRTTEIRFL